MARVKDLWLSEVKAPAIAGPLCRGRCAHPSCEEIRASAKSKIKQKTARHPDNGGSKTAKRWLAVWLVDGKEQTQAFHKQADAQKHARDMGHDVDHGDYIDPKAGKELFGEIGKRWLASRVVDPTSRIRYESVYKHQVEPKFGKRQIKNIKPSEVQQWIAELSEKYEPNTVAGARLVLQGVLQLAVADETIKKNAARSDTLQMPSKPEKDIVAWGDDRLYGVIDAHDLLYQAMVIVGAGCGLRQGELFGLGVEDIDYEEQVLHVRRQIKPLGRAHVFAMPKSDRERTVPLPQWVAQAVRRHVERFPPAPCTLPWEKPDGKLRTHKILFRYSDGKHHRRGTYNLSVWKPALAAAGVIPQPVKEKGKPLRYAEAPEDGMHALRHYYASVMLADGVSIKELAEYLGHKDAGFTLRVYAHMLPSSHERARKAIDNRLFRPRAVV